MIDQQKTGSYSSIDVVIPVYNGQKYILQALASVVRQTYTPGKIIVIDDGSTDNTPRLVKNFKSDVSIEYVKKSNGGLSSARNAGMARCTAEYIAFLDADDEWYPKKLEEQIKVFQKSDLKNLGVVYCEYHIIDEKGVRNNEYYIFKLDRLVRGDVFNKLLEGNKIHGSGSGVLVRKECLDKAGRFDETLKACEDWDMWLRLSKLYEFDFVLRELVKIRKHEGNMQREAIHMFKNRLRFYEKWITELPADSKCFIVWRRTIVDFFITSFPEMKPTGFIDQILSRENKNKLFKRTLGSFRLYLFMMSPVITYRLFKRLIFKTFQIEKTR